MNNQEIRMLTENGRGRLHPVKTTRRAFECYDCSNDIPSGSRCYTQGIHVQEIFFAQSVRICESCAEEQIKKGVEVVS